MQSTETMSITQAQISEFVRLGFICENYLRKVLLSSLVVSLSLCLATIKDGPSQAV